MILLVEDEAIFRMDFVQMLRADGYEVLEAADGAKAIALLEQHYQKIELSSPIWFCQGSMGLLSSMLSKKGGPKSR